MKPWQHDIELERLKAIESAYSGYNKYALGNPFMEFKKHQIAKALHDDELKIGKPEFGYEGPMWCVKRVKVGGKITAYQDVIIGAKMPKDNVYTRLGCSPEFFKSWFMISYNPSWIYHWREDTAMHEVLRSIGFHYMGPKISSFGDVMGIYFRDEYFSNVLDNFDGRDASTYKFVTRPAPYHQPLEETSIKRVWKGIKLNVDPILETLGTFLFTNHYSNYNDAKAWSAISLRGYRIDWKFIAKPAEMNKKWKEKNPGWEKWKLTDTIFNDGFPIMHVDFPHVEELLQKYFKGNEIHRIRFMKLAPNGGELQRHTDQVDPDCGATPGKLGRFHFPIITNPKMMFSSWDWNAQELKVHMNVGECWYLDTRKPHRAINNGTTDRIHLVVDVVLTPKLIRTIEDAKQD